MPNRQLPKNVRLEKIPSVVQIMMSQTNFTLLIYTISEKCPLKFNWRLFPSSLHPSPHFVFPFIRFEPTPFPSSLWSISRHKSEISYIFILQIAQFRIYTRHFCKQAYVNTACSHKNGLRLIHNTKCRIMFLPCKNYTAARGCIEANDTHFPKASWYST